MVARRSSRPVERNFVSKHTAFSFKEDSAAETVSHQKIDSTLRNVPPPLLWIVVEKSMQSAETAKILRGTGVMRFGTWPVARLVENQRSRISRRFHVDMAGFAFNSTVLWDPKRWNHPTLEPIRLRGTARGFQETTFIEQLVEDESQMEGLANNCSEIMVWHLHLEAPELIYPKGWLMQKNLEVVVPLT
ncbi:putative beta-1,4-xylosyltransferase IRX9H [Cocos nucifera]|nr:putative beta-1,4-xylosyltransferase IRX9H [Cocos nucifera]EHA8590740.1 putative beta-1,4-xylosyltransferase IRX9H [Cocos nucifera]